MRLKLADFNDRVRNHEKAIISIRASLSSLKRKFNSEDRVLPAEFRDTIECLALLRLESQKFHAFIERSNYLPLAVVPLRLPLLMALQEIETLITKLNLLLIALRNDSWTTLVQPVEQIFEVNNNLGQLDLKSEEILDEIGILLDKARFKEREYSVA